MLENVYVCTLLSTVEHLLCHTIVRQLLGDKPQNLMRLRHLCALLLHVFLHLDCNGGCSIFHGAQFGLSRFGW